MASEQRQIINSGWHIVLCEPNMELTADEGLRIRGFESFCPSEYADTKTNRMENGRRVRVMRPKAMITGYDFVRFETGKWDFDGVRRVKGVRDFMKIEGKPAGLLPKEIDRLKFLHVQAHEKHEAYLAKKLAQELAYETGEPEVEFERGKMVRVDGPLGEEWIAEMVQQRGSNRVAVLWKNAKIIVDHRRVHSIEQDDATAAA